MDTLKNKLKAKKQVGQASEPQKGFKDRQWQARGLVVDHVHRGDALRKHFNSAQMSSGYNIRRKYVPFSREGPQANESHGHS